MYSIKEEGQTDNLERTSELTQLNYTFTGIQEGKKYEITVDTKNEYGQASRTIIVKTGGISSNQDSLIAGIENIQNSGFYKINVEGKTTEESKEVAYNIHAIVYKGNLNLNGTNNVEGATLANNIYEFGDKTIDVGKADTQNQDGTTETGYAKNMVILKVEGDLTISQGVTLTACKSDDGYGGPKGMLIYCTGKLTNNGTISMTARGAKAEGQDVFLWKNTNGTFEYVPADGGKRWRCC